MRILIVAIAALLTAALAGCSSNQSVTLKDANNKFTVVFTADSSTISQLKQQKISASDGTLVDGDQHAGAQVCSGDFKGKSGNTYHIVAYGEIQSQVCSDQSLSTVLP